jgi:hypothetical protein
MLKNIISSVKKGDIKGLKNGRNIFGWINVVSNSDLDKSNNRSFIYLHKSRRRILFSLIKKAKG